MKSGKILSLIIAFVMVVQLLPVSFSASYSGEDALSGINLEVYNKLKTAIESISAGKVSSTEITIEVSCTTTELGVAPITDNATISAAANAFVEKVDFHLILSYLICDLPYELCWLDKASEVYVEQSYTGKGTTLTVEILVALPVATDYQAGGSSTSVSSSKISSARTAAKYAQSVVEKYSGYSDEEKLTAFRDTICSLVSYETSYSGYDYGDIWQLVYVFDQDPDTNVVCEGYAKAFKYLCDLAGIDCITVSGKMTGGTGEGAHMWNIVRLDGVNYLVDVTNSDTGAIGQNGGLFMVCASDASSSDSSGYSFAVGTKIITYVYDSVMFSLYPSSYLTLGTVERTTVETSDETSDEAVEEATEETVEETVEEPAKEVHIHTLTRTKAEAATCMTDGNIDYWYCSGCDTYFSDENATTEITLDDTVIEATGHSYEAVVTDPTCTECGYTTYTCSACGDSYAEEIEALGHDYEETVTAPTCTESGYTTHVCSACGDSYIDSETEALGHDYIEEVTTEATYFRAGVRAYTCQRCGNSYAEEIEALGIDIEEAIVTVLIPICSFAAVQIGAQCLASPLKLLLRGVLEMEMRLLMEHTPLCSAFLALDTQLIL
ncbi:MAG: hypothetical protein LUG86_01780 [Oscillospiraceae bacterium]|nr:hypothetical protein [Oscillospiraceae bacterium]